MKFLATLLATGLLSVGAHAATVTFTSTNPLHDTEISQTNILGYFDSSLGTLTGLSLTLTGSNTTLLTLINNASNTQTVRATTNTNLFFGSSLTALNALFLNSPALSLALTGDTGFQTLAAGANVSFGPFIDSDSEILISQLDPLKPNFALAGGGNFSVTCSSLSGLGLQGGGGNISSNQSTQANCGASITYAYTPGTTTPPNDVPEPGSMALIGLGLAGLVCIRRRKI